MKAGDWVRFRRDGRLVIGKVEYVVERIGLGCGLLQTDAGEVWEADVLEVRGISDTRDVPKGREK